MRAATRAGWKASSASSFSPAPRNLIGAPVTLRMDSAAPPRRIAIDAGQDDAGELTPVVEDLGDIDRVLAGQAVGHQQGLMRIGELP